MVGMDYRSYCYFFAWHIGSTAIDKAKTKDIPNVMGVNYTDAEKVLKENGFKVTSIETDAGNILANDRVHNRSVKAGEVFKINNNTSPDYTYGTTKDKKITIYYAKDDYTYEKPLSDPMASDSNSNANTNSSGNLNGSSDWKQFLKDYEAWVDSYVAFMRKYKDTPQNPALLSESQKFITQTTEWAEKSKKYENSLKDMSTEDYLEYMKSVTKILGKISEIK